MPVRLRSGGSGSCRTPTKPSPQSLWTSAVEGRDADEQIERPAQIHPTIETGQAVLLAKNAIDVMVVGDYPVGPDEARIPGHHVTRPTLTEIGRTLERRNMPPCGLCDPDHSDRDARMLRLPRGGRSHGQHPLIRGLVGPLPDRRPERARIAFGVRRGHCDLGDGGPANARLRLVSRIKVTDPGQDREWREKLDENGGAPKH